MKRRDLIAHLERHGCTLSREGSRHSVYYNPAANRKATVPRHREVEKGLAAAICKQLGVPTP